MKNLPYSPSLEQHLKEKISPSSTNNRELAKQGIELCDELMQAGDKNRAGNVLFAAASFNSMFDFGFDKKLEKFTATKIRNDLKQSEIDRIIKDFYSENGYVFEEKSCVLGDCGTGYYSRGEEDIRIFTTYCPGSQGPDSNYLMVTVSDGR